MKCSNQVESSLEAPQSSAMLMLPLYLFLYVILHEPLPSIVYWDFTADLRVQDENIRIKTQ